MRRLNLPTLYCLVPMIALAACGRADSDPAAGGLTVGERESLEQAADRLDSRPAGPGEESAKALEADVRQRLDADLAKNQP